jgi:hypothetical protein
MRRIWPTASGYATLSAVSWKRYCCFQGSMHCHHCHCSIPTPATHAHICAGLCDTGCEHHVTHCLMRRSESYFAHKPVCVLHAARHLLFPAEHNPGNDLLEALAGVAEAKVNAFTSQNISNLVWSCAVHVELAAQCMRACVVLSNDLTAQLDMSGAVVCQAGPPPRCNDGSSFGGSMQQDCRVHAPGGPIIGSHHLRCQ